MVKITLITDNPREVDIVPETMTVREFLEKHNVNYGLTTTSIDGSPLNSAGMDMSFMDHHVTDRAIVASLPNKDNAAQATILGSTCVIKSELTPDQIKKVKKIHPEALEMYDENGEMSFKVDIDETTPGCMNRNGAMFGNATSSDGKATITIVIDPEAQDVEQLVIDKLGQALLSLKEMEEHIAEVLPEIDEEENAIRAMITRI